VLLLLLLSSCWVRLLLLLLLALAACAVSLQCALQLPHRRHPYQHHHPRLS
jgi:hypothetical protein